MEKWKSGIISLLFLALGYSAVGQTYLYFQDSPSDEYYDPSWMELTAPSELERKGADLRKFPVETVIPAEQGLNSLRLNWKSMTGGTWVAIAAGTGWAEKDIHDTDSLQFWLYSVEGLDTTNLPRIFMEDVANKKTYKHHFSEWSPSLPAATWVRVTLPMSLFLLAGDGVDFTRIKTIGFSQNTADGTQHTLLIDNMRVFKGSGTSEPAAAPTGLTAAGYDSHIELRWNPNAGDNLSGYAVQRSLNQGTFTTIGLTGESDTLYIDHVREFGTAVTASYRVLAMNNSGELSAPSDTAAASTREFSDEELLDMLQEYTFRYFWHFAHPSSGMARERNTSGNTVTSGGSGFGIMALLTGIHRGYISRAQGLQRMVKMVDFLENADRFHGAWPHWLNGNTGQVIAFSTYDNGGDLVETAFLIEGLLAARQFFSAEDETETDLRARITALWESVEWDWYRKNGSDALYWHWSPNYNWQMNMQIRGWNEAAIVYLLAIASPAHPVPASLWHSGWAGMSYYINGKSFYGYPLAVGWDYGGPLFFAHYSFLGFDPRNKKDAYANYFKLNRNHTLINRAWCMDNPLGFEGYGENCWGLTASDDPDGYMAHEPVAGRDNGTITPSAALSSMPYTPEESLAALAYLYRQKGHLIWGPMGFYDAFNEERNWFADSYLAIDQGPIIGMIENHRSGLLWQHFMANPEITTAIESIGFTEDLTTGGTLIKTASPLKIIPNPVQATGTLFISVDKPGRMIVEVTDPAGRILMQLANEWFEPGEYALPLQGKYSDGLYLVRLRRENAHDHTEILIVKNY